jgi:rare lipoprotein A
MGLLVSLLLLLGSADPTEAISGTFQKGKASFYAKKFNGRRTANGERVDNAKLSAAHRTLPFNTLVEVTNLHNSRSVVVRINDRGPFTKGRVMDLSHAAAQSLGIISRGVGNVSLRVVGKAGKLAKNSAVALVAPLFMPDALPLKPVWEPGERF